ncbi:MULTISPECIES: DUF3800 domain-containing protein [unclassified Bradyrhizobium]|uniref:DUF3800 domain-containing protein n=1 Tax=unclassified Bradyrhizobium TaxID=2631580 RepID=UPI0024790C1A|nr:MULTISPECIES: DUF3800 domain-containing protein [unclassified Bradyrhizobium]WGR70651.1 DUF3800 domain-containing protein [Bradyrhizobium sp. ISRA426]WGR75489.1 DUF3800 domain-containing protein [Bradyrhizobium sp. ISRA430]WGR85892.1 DUF3800 domain-containing protein [Bradyrhizobium sp. ISRA432]
MATQIPAPYYIAYIDEAGDAGLKAVRPIDPVGATEWLCLGAVLIRAKHESEVQNWVRTILSKIGSKRSDLHYRHLSAAQKRTALEMIAQLPIRGFVLASNKKNMRRYRNERAEHAGAQQWFYNYCLRLLLERVTDFCHRHATKDRANNRFVKIMYSERSIHS